MIHPRPKGVSWPCRQDLWAIALLALVVRVSYLFVGLTSLDLQTLAMVASDSTVYAQLADHFRLGSVVEDRLLLVAAPGYPILLTGFALVFGPGLWPPVLLNILLGALAPVAVYLLAASLLHHRPVARFAALVAALSFTGLSMSTSLLTDQPFYTLHAFGLLFFVWGMQSGRANWFVAAGVVSTLATVIRPLGQMWPWIYVLLAAGWLLAERPTRPWRIFVQSLCAPALMLVLIVAWSAHNFQRHGLFTFTTNGVRASWAYLVATAVADHTPGGSFDSVRTAWSDQVHAPLDGSPPTEVIVHQRMKTQVLTQLREHPGWLLESYVSIVWQNTRASNHFAEAQVPAWAGLWKALRNLCHDWFNPLLFCITVLGWMFLLKEKMWAAALVLGTTYAYFTMTAGFSFWQGSRLHFPAEMAWSILVPYFGLKVGEIWRRWRYGRAVALSS